MDARTAVCLPPDQAIGHTGQGDFLLDAEGRVSRGPGLVYSGAQIIRTESLADIPDRAFSLNVVWDRMMAEGRVFGTVYPGTWCDVGHPGGIALAEAMLDAGDV